MSFFDVSGRPAPPPAAEPEQPEWMGPPRGVLPGISAQRVAVFKTDRAFLMAHRFAAYPNGVEFTLELRVRSPEDHRHDLFRGMHHPPDSRPLSDEFFRLGVLLSDGTRWSNVERSWPPNPATEPPPRPVVMPRGGGGGGDSYRMRYWMWPLPPTGALTLVAEWPALDVPESRGVVDASELRARAAEAEPIWPESGI